MKLIYIDTETTGTDAKLNGIIQLAGIIEANDDIREFNFKIKPFDGDIIEDRALEVSHTTREMLDGYMSPTEAHLAFTTLLSYFVSKFDRQDKFFFIGYNAHFDYEFIYQWFLKAGDKYCGSWFWYPPIDVMAISGFSLMEKRSSLPNFKLGTVAEFLGIKSDGELHDAMTDIKLTKKLYEHFSGKGKANDTGN